MIKDVPNAYPKLDDKPLQAVSKLEELICYLQDSVERFKEEQDLITKRAIKRRYAYAESVAAARKADYNGPDPQFHAIVRNYLNSGESTRERLDRYFKEVREFKRMKWEVEEAEEEEEEEEEEIISIDSKEEKKKKDDK